MNANSNVIPRGTDNAKLIKVIRTESIKGAGIEKDPVRIIVQYWSLQGQLLATVDNYLDEIKSSASSQVSS